MGFNQNINHLTGIQLYISYTHPPSEHRQTTVKHTDLDMLARRLERSSKIFSQMVVKDGDESHGINQQSPYQWLFLVPLKGGRDYIIPQKAIYKWYISGIYCQLGD